MLEQAACTHTMVVSFTSSGALCDSSICLFINTRLRCNLAKNRYKDVVCYDESRVVLKGQPGVEGSDYIHANYVNGYNKKQAFILTQGTCLHLRQYPLPGDL